MLKSYEDFSMSRLVRYTGKVEVPGGACACQQRSLWTTRWPNACAQARARQLSLEQWAVTILTNASERPHEPQTWTDLNARRLALLRKRGAAELNDQEQQELAHLQDAAAKVFEPADRSRLEHLRQAVPELPGSMDG
jgi:hypothetical protein